ncbi:MAG: hypothetical protein COV67_06725 [Nitrospinae bacterium CG11_big_fil_rev_8_21_14_0_20_56_8]|nr:MAG: hypothetical protein COV67_06725 [Nitrospinae bacterium CG11_big_fil_rev_8_21_14_0_20_56_8]
MVLCVSGPVSAADTVEFSGVVKKVISDSQKVAIQDPKTKKRFTLVVDAKTRLEGFKDFGDIKADDSVAGAYVVTAKGMYIATRLERK